MSIFEFQFKLSVTYLLNNICVEFLFERLTDMCIRTHTGTHQGLKSWTFLVANR